MHKKESCKQDSPPAAGRFSDIIPLRRSAILPGGLYYVIEHYGVISDNIIKVLTLKHSSMSEPIYFTNYFLGLRRPVFSEPRTSSW